MTITKFMKNKMTPLFLALTLITFGIHCKTTELTFPLHTSDELCMNINNILKPEQMLNELNVQTEGEVDCKIPNTHKEFMINNFLSDEFDLKSIVDTTVFGKKMSILAKNSQGSVIGAIMEIDPLKKTSLSKIHIISHSDADCSRIHMDETKMYTACFSTSQKRPLFCEVDHSQDLIYSCNSYDFNMDLKLEEGKVDLQMFNGRGKNKLFTFHVKSAEQGFNLVKNKFYLKDSFKTGLITLEDKITILKISPVFYDFSKKIAHLIILVEDEKKEKKIRSYNFLDFMIVKHDDNDFEEFPFKAEDMYFKDRSFFVIIPPSDNKIEILNVNLREKKFPKFPLIGQSSFKRAMGSRNMFVFETESTDGKTNWFILDNLCQRYFKFDGIIQEIASLKWTILQIGYSTFAVVIKENNAILYEILSFENVCAKKVEGRQFTKAKLDFFVFKEKNLSAVLEINNFDQLSDKDIASSDVSLDLNHQLEKHFFLNIKGNNMEFSSDSKVYFFHKISFINFDEEEKCLPLKLLIKNRNIVTLCKGNQIIVHSGFGLNFHEKEYDFKFKTMYQFDIVDLKKIVAIKYFFAQFLLLVDDQNIIYYINLSTNDDVKISRVSILEEFDECHFMKHDFLCNKGPLFVTIRASKNDKELVFTTINAEELLSTELKSVVVSSFHENTLFYIRKSFHTQNKYHLIEERYKVDIKISKNGMNIGANTQIIEVNKDELVLINKDNFEVIGLISGSVVHYPPAENKFKEILSVKIIEDAKIFIIMYSTLDGKVRLYLGKSSLLIYDRLIKDVEVGSFVENLEVEAHYITSRNVLIVVYQKGNPTFIESFILYLNGPVFYVEPETIVNSIDFRVNTKKYHIPFAERENVKSLSISTKDVTITDQNEKAEVYNLELSKNLVINGPIANAEDLSNNDNIEFISRMNLISRHIIKLSQKGLNSHISHSLKSCQQDFVFFYDNVLYDKKQGKANRRYKNCKFITKGEPQLKQLPLLLCTEKTENDNVITNLVDEPIFLNAKDIKINQHNLIEEEKILYYAGRVHNDKNIMFWKFTKENDSYKLQNKRIILTNDFYLNSRTIENFFMSSKLIPEKLVFLIHEAFSQKITVKIFDTTTNVFERYNFDEISLPKEKGMRSIYEFYCTEIEKKLTCVIRSDQYIFDTEINYSVEKGFSFEVKTKYQFFTGATIDHNLKVEISDRFLAVFVKAELGSDIFLFKRNFALAENYLFSSLKLKSREKVTKISISDNIRGVDSNLYVSVFADQISDSDVYKGLYIDEYRLSDFNIKVKQQSSYKNELSLSFTDSQNGVHTTSINITFHSNYVNRVLAIMMIVLLILFLIGAGLVYYVYSENKKFKHSKNQEGHDQSMFLDRTMMQI